MVMENPKYNQYLWDITGKGIYGVRGKCKGLFGYSWKLKIEKYCNKIIFKCVNSIMEPIFNEIVAKK